MNQLLKFSESLAFKTAELKMKLTGSIYDQAYFLT